jgi:hypothetical protein
MPERERERIEPTPAGQARLMAAIGIGTPTCVIDPGALGEYAVMRIEDGQVAADAAFPVLARHLRAGCARCADDLPVLLALLAEADDQIPADTPPRPDTLVPSAALHDAVLAQDNVSLVTDRPAERPGGDSASGSPTDAAPRTGALPRQRQGLRVRDWLLIGAAALIVFVGVVLLGLAYLAISPPGPTPAAPTAAPAAPTSAPALAPAGPSSAGARALPSGMNCPATHPVKGNRESMIYHLPSGQFYAQTRPEECFATPADAEAAGYRRSQR